MPRKKSPKGTPMNAAGHELKAVRLELPMDVHKHLRIIAAEREQSMATYVRHLVEVDVARWLRRRNKSK